MPELPEVEVVRRSLNEFITGSKINKVSIFNKNLRYKISKKFKKSIQGQKIISIFRRGKFLLIQLENKNFILIHLGMTGKIFIKRKFDKTTVFTDYYFDRKIIKKHNHLELQLSNSVDLIYNDIRKFGFLKILSNKNLEINRHISKLGPEPLSSDFNFNYLKNKCKKKYISIKNFIMDQKNISGLGNIYANEILFLRSIHPKKMTYKLLDEQILKIISSTKRILTKAIQLGGSSIKDFNSISGKKGDFQNKFKVYNRTNKSCLKPKCDGSIKKYISAIDQLSTVKNARKLNIDPNILKI